MREEKEQSNQELWDNIKWSNMCIIGIPAEREKIEQKNYLKKY